jgi:hypothetical protein
MKLFIHHADVGGFTYTPEYKELLEALDLGWWDGRAWLGRLFSMDNDVGEHWMDNDELVEARADLAARAGLDLHELMVPDPERMADGSDGPCNTTEFRMRFWTEVLACLDLSEQLIIDSARAWHGLVSSAEEVAALEERIAAWQQKRAKTTVSSEKDDRADAVARVGQQVPPKNSLKLFLHHADVGAFTYTPEYVELCEVLRYGWECRAWLGRLFSMDNDVGEHWMDNESLVEARADLAVRAGLDPDLLMVPDPERMADGRDGPCNTTEFRMRFWTEVVACLVLSDQLIIDSARAWHGKCSSVEEVAALEQRIAAWQQKRAMR